MRMSASNLIAGPWVGEFGWELFAWQGYLRSLSKHFFKTTIICRENSSALYKDFTDNIIHHNLRTGESDCWFMNNCDIKKSAMQIFNENNIHYENSTVLLPTRIGAPPKTHWSTPISIFGKSIKPEYILFGNKNIKRNMCIFHVRNRKHRSADNWSKSNWDKLFNLISQHGFEVGCIGTKSEALLLEGAIDFRDIDMPVLFDILSNSVACFGPSSGPMHLASLCGCPHVVWSIDSNYERYTNNWNPLNTPVLFLSDYSWHPTPEFIYEKYTKWANIN